MHFITFWCNSTTRIVQTPQVRASNSVHHVGVAIPAVFKQVLSQICIHKTHFKLSCGTSAVGGYVAHVLLSVGKLNP